MVQETEQMSVLSNYRVEEVVAEGLLGGSRWTVCHHPAEHQHASNSTCDRGNMMTDLK